MNCGGVPRRHHNPLPAVNKYLQIAKCMHGVLLQHIVRVLPCKGQSFIQMRLVLRFAVCNILFEEHARKLKHRRFFTQFLPREYRHFVLDLFGFENGRNPLPLCCRIPFYNFLLFAVYSVPRKDFLQKPVAYGIYGQCGKNTAASA